MKNFENSTIPAEQIVDAIPTGYVSLAGMQETTTWFANSEFESRTPTLPVSDKVVKVLNRGTAMISCGIPGEGDTYEYLSQKFELGDIRYQKDAEGSLIALLPSNVTTELSKMFDQGKGKGVFPSCSVYYSHDKKGGAWVNVKLALVTSGKVKDELKVKCLDNPYTPKRGANKGIKQMGKKVVVI